MDSQDYCVEEDEKKCEDCIYNIIGERRDKQGFVIKTSACLSEGEICASCCPTYQFPDYYIYEGKMSIRKGKMDFKHKGKLKPNVTKIS